jgi:hypothetical protein
MRFPLIIALVDKYILCIKQIQKICKIELNSLKLSNYNQKLGSGKNKLLQPQNHN